MFAIIQPSAVPLFQRSQRWEAVISKIQASLVSSACILALYASPAAAQSASFQGLGDLPGGDGQGRATAVSGDGGVVVGYAYHTYQEAFRWTASGGIEGIGYVPGGIYSNAYGVSADGSTIVGVSGPAFNSVAFRWTAGGGMESLDSGGCCSVAFDVSGDGSVVVGWSNSLGAFRWTQGLGMVTLGNLPGGTDATANAVSDNGEVVVGSDRVGDPMFDPNAHEEAFRWTQATGMVGLGALPGGTDSRANDISGDGLVIVGIADNGSGWEAFRWAQGAMQGLGFESALAVNYDGSVIVGSSSGRATIWSDPEGVRYVDDVLTSAGVAMTGWSLESAEGVSADGDIIVGIGHDPGGDLEPWIARLNLGLVTLSDLRVSLSSIVGVGQSAQQIESAHLGGLIDLASTYGASSESAGAWSAWGGMNIAHYNILGIDPEARQGDLGFAYQLTSAWRLGAGVRWGGREDDVLVFDGENDSDYAGLSLFGSYEPSRRGLRVHGALAANWLKNEIQRGYLNGSALTFSRGEQDGFAYGAALRIGWAAPLSERIAVTPFASYEASRVELDAYTEITGPFPAHFEDTKGNLDIARAGAQLDLKASAALRFWATGDRAMRRQRELPGVSGEVIALSLPFAIEGAETSRAWWEAGLGAEWRASNATRLQFGINASTDGDTAAHYGARVSAIVSF